jgi:hypothetical protein
MMLYTYNSSDKIMDDWFVPKNFGSYYIWPLT